MGMCGSVISYLWISRVVHIAMGFCKGESEVARLMSMIHTMLVARESRSSCMALEYISHQLFSLLVSPFLSPLVQRLEGWVILPFAF